MLLWCGWCGFVSKSPARTALCVMGVVRRLMYGPINEPSVATQQTARIIYADKPRQFVSIEYALGCRSTETHKQKLCSPTRRGADNSDGMEGKKKKTKKESTDIKSVGQNHLGFTIRPQMAEHISFEMVASC